MNVYITERLAERLTNQPTDGRTDGHLCIQYLNYESANKKLNLFLELV